MFNWDEKYHLSRFTTLSYYTRKQMKFSDVMLCPKCFNSAIKILIFSWTYLFTTMLKSKYLTPSGSCKTPITQINCDPIITLFFYEVFCKLDAVYNLKIMRWKIYIDLFKIQRAAGLKTIRGKKKQDTVSFILLFLQLGSILQPFFKLKAKFSWY